METFFFDLDGTLADSREGLFGAFRAGMAEIGIADVPDRALQRFLGTPLPIMFGALRPGVRDAETEAGILAFRQYYDERGIFQNTLYPGVRDMLLAVRAAGARAWVVTSKPAPHAERSVSLLGIAPLLDGIVAASLAETDTKTELVATALDRSGAAPRQTVMLGDRSYDMVGALENGVAPVGALWGYGSEAELRDAGCRRFAQSADGFADAYVRRMDAVAD